MMTVSFRKETSFLCNIPPCGHQPLRASKVLPHVATAKKPKSFGLPIKSHSQAATSINADTLRHRINLGASATPIPILMVVVKPSPLTSGFAVVTARRKQLEIPIAGLDDTELRAI